MVMFYGICISDQGTTMSAHKLQYIYCLAMPCFVLGVEFSRHYRVTFYNKRKLINKRNHIYVYFEDNDSTLLQKIIIWSIVASSIVLCGFLFARHGGNLFIQALMNFMNNNYTSLSEARKNYVDVVGIGYIYQFRVILLPVLASYLLFFEKKPSTKLITLPVYIIMITFLLGTGQRNAFVFYCVIMLIYVRIMKKTFGIFLVSKPCMIVIAVIALALLVILTIGNGRVDGADKVGGAIYSLIRRVFLIDQESAIVGFAYMDSQATVWGYDWWKMLEQILPGKSDYVPVANISYYIVYGTFRGTNPPCLWGSAWYNFHILGITIIPFIIGSIYQQIYSVMKGYKGKDRLYVLIYAGLCTYLGVWTSGTPMTLFNNGVVTLIILYWLCYKACRKSVC